MQKFSGGGLFMGFANGLGYFHAKKVVIYGRVGCVLIMQLIRNW